MHAKKLFTWNEKKVHLGKANQIGAFVTHNFLGRDLPPPEALITVIESSPNPLPILANEKLKQIQRSRIAKLEHIEELEKQKLEEAKLVAPLNIAQRGRTPNPNQINSIKLTTASNTTGVIGLSEPNVRRPVGRPRKVRQLSPPPPDSSDRQPAKRARGSEPDVLADEDALHNEESADVLQSEEAGKIRAVLFPSNGINRVMTLNEELVTSLEKILHELRSVYGGAFLHALLYFRHALRSFIRKDVDRASASINKDIFMNTVRSIFCLHQNADSQFQSHVEKYILSEGLLFEYYYLIFAVISMFPNKVHNVETLREAAKNLILKVERSCTEEQVKNIKSHLLKFSIDSKHMTPEVHIGELSRLCSLFPPPLRSDLYEVFSYFKTRIFPSFARGALPDSALIVKGSHLLRGSSIGGKAQLVVDRIAGLLSSFSDDFLIKEILENPQAIRIPGASALDRRSDPDAIKGVAIPKSIDRRIRLRLLDFYRLVEPHIAGDEALNDFVRALNQAIRIAFTRQNNENLLKKAVKSVYDEVPRILHSFIPSLRGKILRIFTAAASEEVHESNDMGVALPETVNRIDQHAAHNEDDEDVSSWGNPDVVDYSDLAVRSSMMVGGDKFTGEGGCRIADELDESCLSQSADCSIGVTHSIEVCAELHGHNLPSISDVLMAVCGDYTPTNPTPNLVNPILNDPLDHLDQQNVLEIGSSSHIEMDLEFNPLPDSMELGCHDGASEGAKLLIGSTVPSDIFSEGNHDMLLESDRDVSAETQNALAVELFTNRPPSESSISDSIGSVVRNDVVVITQKLMDEVPAQSISCDNPSVRSTVKQSNISDMHFEQPFVHNLLEHGSVGRDISPVAQFNLDDFGNDALSTIKEIPNSQFVSIELQKSTSANSPPIISTVVHPLPPTFGEFIAREESVSVLSSQPPQMNGSHNVTDGCLEDNVVLTISDSAEQMKFRISKDKQLRKLFKKYYKTKGYTSDALIFTLKGVLLNPSTTVSDANIADGDEIQALPKQESYFEM